MVRLWAKGNCAGAGDGPERGEGQETVDGLAVVVAADVAEVGVEQELLAVGPVGIVIQAVGPRREERNAAEGLARLELGGTVERGPEDVLAVHLHFVRDVADRRRDRNFDVAYVVDELDDIDVVDRRAAGGVVGGLGHEREE
jgi:hypothetical protein